MLKWMIVSSIGAICGCIYFLLNINDNSFGVIFWLFSWMVLYVPLMQLKKDRLKEIN